MALEPVLGPSSDCRCSPPYLDKLNELHRCYGPRTSLPEASNPVMKSQTCQSGFLFLTTTSGLSSSLRSPSDLWEFGDKHVNRFARPLTRGASAGTDFINFGVGDAQLAPRFDAVRATVKVRGGFCVAKHLRRDTTNQKSNPTLDGCVYKRGQLVMAECDLRMTFGTSRCRHAPHKAAHQAGRSRKFRQTLYLATNYTELSNKMRTIVFAARFDRGPTG